MAQSIAELAVTLMRLLVRYVSELVKMVRVISLFFRYHYEDSDHYQPELLRKLP
jgi:hypothetical protein